MKIAIIMEYTQNKVGVTTLELNRDMLPIDVAPNMVCNPLREIPTGVVYLGSSSLGDVTVLPITEEQEVAIQAIYTTPLEELEPGEAPEYYAEYGLQIAADAAIKLAKSFLRGVKATE
jgi:hypothetical protein